MRLLDLFCGAGGAAMGYHRAGFTEIVGVDCRVQRNYPFAFVHGCALEFLTDETGWFDAFGPFDLIHASPPCQAYCALKHLHPKKVYPDLIEKTRRALQSTGLPYVIENVPKSPLIKPIQLCGSSFGLRVRRHRLFESSLKIKGSSCWHKNQGRPIDVSGTGGRRINRRPDDHGGNLNKPRSIEEARKAMGIDWMTRAELSQAIPPAYTEYLGRQLVDVLFG